MAICCWPRALRTMSSPLESGAYRKLRAPSPGLSAPMVATSDFSGFESSDCALASAAASAAIDSLDRCMGGLRFDDVEADCACLRSAGADSMAHNLFGIFRNERLELGPGPLMLAMGFPSAQKDACEFGPAVRGAHVDDLDGLDAGPWWLHSEQAWGLTRFDAPPELFFGREQQVLVERIGRDGDLNPFPTPGDDGEHGHLDVRDPHVVLELGHVLFGGPFLRKRPRQHELGLEDRSSFRHDPVEGRPHPADHRMAHSALDVPEGLSGVALEPVPIERLGNDPELDDELFGKIFGLDLAPLFAPKP